MKNIRYIVTGILTAGVLVSAVSCADVLDIQSPSQYQEGTVWQSGTENLDMYIIGHYGTLRDESQLYNINGILNSYLLYKESSPYSLSYTKH